MFTNFDFCNWLNRFTLYCHLSTVVMCAVICIIYTFFILLTYSSTSPGILQIFSVIALSMHRIVWNLFSYEWPYFFVFCLNHTDNKRCDWRQKRLVLGLVNIHRSKSRLSLCWTTALSLHLPPQTDSLLYSVLRIPDSRFPILEVFSFLDHIIQIVYRRYVKTFTQFYES